MNASAADLFGEPPRTAELSQYFTPAWLARRAATLIPLETEGRPTRVLEPSAGRGNLVEGLRANGMRTAMITAVERDERWLPFLLERFGGLQVHHADFLSWAPSTPLPRFDYAFMNPPYEDGADVAHVVRALELCDRVIAIVKSDFEYGAERDRVLWSRARVTRRRILVDRPDFGETMEKPSLGAARNYVVLEIVPALNAWAAYTVDEVRWRKRGAE